MPIYKVPEEVYAKLLATNNYEQSKRVVSTLWHVVPHLRKKLRTQLAEGKKNRELWHKDTKRFKRFLELNKGDITNINVALSEINFIFIKENCQVVTITTTKGEYTFTISLDFAIELTNQITEP